MSAAAGDYKVQSGNDTPDQRFVCDRMLGTLARWLRLAGFDTLYPEEMPYQALQALTEREGRVLLTRNRRLASLVSDAFYVEALAWTDQLDAVVTRFALQVTTSLTRCSMCNQEVVQVSTAAAEGQVPERVLELHETFWHCPGCKRYYWKGTHWEGIVERLERFSSTTQ